MANPEDLKLDSDHPLDKLVLLNTGVLNFNISSDYFIPHDFGIAPMIKAVWSTTPDFATTYGMFDGPISTTPDFPFIPSLQISRANSSQIELMFGNPGTYDYAYIKIYGYLPDGSNKATPWTASQGEDLIINTDLNYSKLLTSGVTASSSVALSHETVNHNLGYYPQAEMWVESNGYISELAGMLLFNSSPSSDTCEITTSQLIFTRDQFTFASSRFHYRIYTDEN